MLACTRTRVRRDIGHKKNIVVDYASVGRERDRGTCACCGGSVHHNRNSKLVVPSVNIDVQELSVQFARTGCGRWAECRRTVNGWRTSSSLIVPSRYANRVSFERYTLARCIDSLCVTEQPGQPFQ